MSELTNEPKLTIKIDVREHDLIQQCKFMLEKNPLFKDIKLVTENLPLGDIIIADQLEEKIIIERKTLGDLASSIKDGRYKEQSYRLSGINHHNHNIIYLIEGDISKYNIFKARMDKMTLYSAIFSINYYKGFSVMRSNSIEETALIITNMVYKMLKQEKEKEKIPYYSNPTPKAMIEQGIVESAPEQLDEEPTSKDYCGVIKKIKKDNITTDNIGEIMLCQIPGVSSVTALAILLKYKTLPQLIMAIHQDNDCLKDISSTNAAGQTRKISKSCVQNIVKFLKT